MRILYLITQADGGGAQGYVLTLAEHFEGVIAAGIEAEKLFKDAQKAGLVTYYLKHLKRNINPYHDILAIWEMHRLIKKLKPDILHLNSTKAGVLGSFAAIGLKTKVTFTAHGFRHNEPMSRAAKNFYIVLEKTASAYRDYIITVSKADEASALSLNLIAKNKISTVYNGLAPIEFLTRDEARRALKLFDDKFLFVTVANFYKTKGIDVLIEAISMVDKNLLKRCLFVIIGDGPEFKHCKLKIETLGLTNNVKLLGRIFDAKKYLLAFDAFILPSRKEGLPFALLEAMQAGLPIIATDVGGNKEALEDAGILIEPENPQKLTKAILTILQDSMIADKIKQKALERAKLFTKEKMLQETKKIYEQVLKN